MAIESNRDNSLGRSGEGVIQVTSVKCGLCRYQR